VRETIKPVKMASPPILAIGLECIRLASLGTSTAPMLKAIFLAIGVAENATIKARTNETKYT
jgi:hypothetical protein